jgi:hypothetical protein
MDITKPLTQLPGKEADLPVVSRGRSCLPAPDEVVYAPVLEYPQPGRKFITDMDSSNVGI